VAMLALKTFMVNKFLRGSC